MAKSDRRVQYTKKVLREAVLELLAKKTIEELTIKEICEKADVNRGTFYLHYTQPRDILEEIEERFLAENMEMFADYMGNDRDPDVMAKIFACIIENKDVCRVLMGEKGDPQFLRKLEELSREGVIEGWKKEFPTISREKLEYLFEFVFTGSMRLIVNWIKGEDPVPLTTFVQRLERLGHYALIAGSEFTE